MNSNINLLNDPNFVRALQDLHFRVVADRIAKWENIAITDLYPNRDMNIEMERLFGIPVYEEHKAILNQVADEPRFHNCSIEEIISTVVKERNAHDRALHTTNLPLNRNALAQQQSSSANQQAVDPLFVSGSSGTVSPTLQYSEQPSANNALIMKPITQYQYQQALLAKSRQAAANKNNALRAQLTDLLKWQAAVDQSFFLESNYTSEVSVRNAQLLSNKNNTLLMNQIDPLHQQTFDLPPIFESSTISNTSTNTIQALSIRDDVAGMLTNSEYQQAVESSFFSRPNSLSRMLVNSEQATVAPEDISTAKSQSASPMLYSIVLRKEKELPASQTLEKQISEFIAFPPLPKRTIGGMTFPTPSKCNIDMTSHVPKNSTCHN